MKKTIKKILVFVIIMIAFNQVTAGTYNKTICSGSSVSIGNTWPNATSYQWNFPFLQCVVPVVVSPTVNTQYILSAYCASNLLGRDTFNVVVNQSPVITNIGSNSPVCVGNTLNLYVSANTACSYYWTGPNGYTSNQQNPVIINFTAANAGNYMVTVMSNGCSTSANTTVISGSNVNVTLNFAQQNICLDAVPFVLTGGYPLGGNYRGSGVFNSMFYPSTVGVGTYNIYYDYTDINGIKGTASALLAVNPLPTVLFNGIFPNPIRLNSEAFQLKTGILIGGSYFGPGVINGWFYPCVAGVGMHTITYTYKDFMSCTNIAMQTITVVNGWLGIEEQTSSNKIRIYPNPVNDVLNVDMDEYLDRIQVVNLTGAVLISEKLNSKKFEIDVSHLSKGMYFVKIISQNGTVESLKIMK